MACMVGLGLPFRRRTATRARQMRHLGGLGLPASIAILDLSTHMPDPGERSPGSGCYSVVNCAQAGVVQNVPFSGNTGNRWSFDGKGSSRFECCPDLNHAPAPTWMHAL